MKKPWVAPAPHNPSTQEVEAGHQKLKIILGYTVSSRPCLGFMKPCLEVVAKELRRSHGYVGSQAETAGCRQHSRLHCSRPLNRAGHGPAQAPFLGTAAWRLPCFSTKLF